MDRLRAHYWCACCFGSHRWFAGHQHPAVLRNRHRRHGGPSDLHPAVADVLECAHNALPDGRRSRVLGARLGLGAVAAHVAPGSAQEGRARRSALAAA